MERPVVSVHLSCTGRQQILLQLDSGSDFPILYTGSKESEVGRLEQATLQAGNVSKAQPAFEAAEDVFGVRCSESESSRVLYELMVLLGYEVPPNYLLMLGGEGVAAARSPATWTLDHRA